MAPGGAGNTGSLHVKRGGMQRRLTLRSRAAAAAVKVIPHLTLNGGDEKPSGTETDDTSLGKEEEAVDYEKVEKEREEDKKGDKEKDKSKDKDTKQGSKKRRVAATGRFTIDPEGELTHDETSVDVVTVPCPGGHALKSWNRDGLVGRYFGAPSMRDAEVSEADRQGPSWVRQGIRREADRARILLYEHPEMVQGTTLNKLAMALLESLRKLRADEGQERPLIFISHSVGGLVVKMALVKASRDPKYESMMRECYGVAFFGTPHQGSSYFSKSSLASSIQSMLQLSAPMPQSLTCELRMGNSLLLHIDEDFKTVSDDLHVWTFYETIDSRLSGSASGDVYFTAPLTSIKSAILGMRQERIFPLQSDHANIASFGRHNSHTLKLFLRQLTSQIVRADLNSKEGQNGRQTFNLEQKVHVEVHGFFHEAAEDMVDGTIRAWSTRLPLRDFLSKGPEECLSERLNEVDDPPDESRFLAKRGRTVVAEIGSTRSMSPPPRPMTVKDALGISQDLPSQAKKPKKIIPRSLSAFDGANSELDDTDDEEGLEASPKLPDVSKDAFSHESCAFTSDQG
ncbi:Protein SERAC1 [Escovopsis weberi]|uniref:Protein SERAC1 n=1 Tax=Escovopsis weberi TaxID=150374 RepID=A0A0M8MYY6_ESCWE|nr:Protein SERAC1 [Escovopsis weberi]